VTLKAGDVRAWERTFTVEDVRAFGEITGDKGGHHVQPDARGRLMVQGLLTATLPTKIGGDLDYIAREMVFEFLRAVFTGDTVRCEVTFTTVEPDGRKTRVEATFTGRNQAGEEVMRGTTRGIVRAAPPSP